MIEHITSPDDASLDAVRDIFREYADSLGVDLAFQDFERELRELPGEYAPRLSAYSRKISRTASSDASSGLVMCSIMGRGP